MPRRLLLVFLAVFAFSACERMGPQKASSGSAAGSGIRNVILMIGDGMGPQQVGLLAMYAHHAPRSVYRSRGGRTALERILEAGTIGYALHEPAGALVTDSGASSTQMAGGEWAGAEMIGIDQNGNRVKTILEIAEEMGKSSGDGCTRAFRTNPPLKEGMLIDAIEK